MDLIGSFALIVLKISAAASTLLIDLSVISYLYRNKYSTEFIFIKKISGFLILFFISFLVYRLVQ